MSEKAKNTDKKGLENLEESLNLRIEKLLGLNTLVRNRAKFNEKKQLLIDAVENLKNDIESNNFETDSHSFTFDIGSKYSSKEAIKISNPLLIKEVAEFVVLKIEEKTQEIEKQIVLEA